MTLTRLLRSTLLTCALIFVPSLGGWDPFAEASCGSASCFVVIGSQQQVSPAGVFTINLLYTNTPNGIPPDGANTIPFANQQKDQLILANNPVSQLKTLIQTATLDINYGLTERLGIEVMVPYRIVSSVPRNSLSFPSRSL